MSTLSLDVFAGGAQAARLTLVDGLAGAVWSVGGRPQVVFAFTVRGGRVVGIELLATPRPSTSSTWSG